MLLHNLKVFQKPKKDHLLLIHWYIKADVQWNKKALMQVFWFYFRWFIDKYKAHHKHSIVSPLLQTKDKPRNTNGGEK